MQYEKLQASGRRFKQEMEEMVREKRFEIQKVFKSFQNIEGDLAEFLPDHAGALKNTFYILHSYI
jgi:hypothetical protein